ncbi:uncharacterized protein LOC103520236 [Diaphorina citri]|jgi:hypothetical protein|uniref:Uncharacterized protein LOC103520236 n=1 Tax=Diaphorina citri TaxID=121845 RepID=A0A1S3DKJ1_DIACI|nr:uncharacterized protein LOC103520236 [Diaphorina citri]KAI5701910.1 hypothetical protein M8J75_014596 [Diaphorina citri]KAI5730718.1 hypothetical protein M8J76_016736 [Diaphorina citri]KAI5734625.1 hypothetical protein M8J77_008858 [Diaphorina citri]
MQKQIVGTIFLTFLSSSIILETLCYPQQHQAVVHDRVSYVTPSSLSNSRKFAEKPNNVKKVVLEDRNDLDDVSTNQISDSVTPAGGFSWSNILTMLMQLIFNPTATTQVGPSKSDVIDTEQPASPWANLLSVGLKILTAILSGGSPIGDGIDKVDNPSPVPQIINILVNLLDALKTSFSHRSMRARSLGSKDTVSEIGMTGSILSKTLVKSLNTDDDICLQRYVCEANQECVNALSNTTSNKHNIYCQLGNYLSSYLLRNKLSLSQFSESGRRGRSQENCKEIYLACNEV